MPYIPNPDDATAPLITEYASTAAAEFRALKAKLNNFFLNTNISTSQNAIYTQMGVAAINTGGSSDLLFGVLGNPTRTTGDGPTLGGFFSAVQGDNIITAGGQFVRGMLVEAYTGSVVSQCQQLIGQDIVSVQRDNNGQADGIWGQRLRFQNRVSALDAGSVVGGLGADMYNTNAIASLISSQRRSTATEKCGWSKGIVFEDYALDEDSANPIPVGIDFSGLATHDSAAEPICMAVATGSLSTAVATNGGAVVMPTVVSKWIPVMVDGVVTHAIPLFTIT